MTFDQIYIPSDADENEVWAIEMEFDMRYRLMERKRDGVAASVGRMAAEMNKLGRALAGDPSVPNPKTKLGTQSEAKGLFG